MTDKWKVRIFDKNEHHYCQHASICNEGLCLSFHISWMMGYATNAADRKAEKQRKKNCIALANEVCDFLNRKGK